MALTEIALLKWETNVSLVSEDCWLAVQLSRRIWDKSRSYLKPGLHISRKDRNHRLENMFFKLYSYDLVFLW